MRKYLECPICSEKPEFRNDIMDGIFKILLLTCKCDKYGVKTDRPSPKLGIHLLEKIKDQLANEYNTRTACRIVESKHGSEEDLQSLLESVGIELCKIPV